MIVDDEPTIRELFSYVFLDAGHEVVMAENGRRALELLGAALPDFMLLDVMMPEMTGKDFIEELARLARTNPALDRIPFIVMTGENFLEGDLNNAFAGRPGFVGYVPKMVVPETVVAQANEAIKTWSARK